MFARVVEKDGAQIFQKLAGSVASGLPVGSILPMLRTTAPDGFILCDGSSFDVTLYPKLYEVLGSSSVPDLRETSLVGCGYNSTSSYAVHDVYNLGQHKDDQVGEHSHAYSNTRNWWNNYSNALINRSDNTTVTEWKALVSDPIKHSSWTGYDTGGWYAGALESHMDSRDSWPNGRHSHSLLMMTGNSGDIGACYSPSQNNRNDVGFIAGWRRGNSTENWRWDLSFGYDLNGDAGQFNQNDAIPNMNRGWESRSSYSYGYTSHGWAGDANKNWRRLVSISPEHSHWMDHSHMLPDIGSNLDTGNPTNRARLGNERNGSVTRSKGMGVNFYIKATLGLDNWEGDNINNIPSVVWVNALPTGTDIKDKIYVINDDGDYLYYVGNEANHTLTQIRTGGSSSIFTGTMAEWTALTQAQRDKYTQANITDQYGDGTVVVDSVTNGDMNAVSSNAVYDALNTTTSGTVTTNIPFASIDLRKKNGVVTFDWHAYQEGSYTFTEGQVIATIPEGYRPAVFKRLTSHNYSTAPVETLVTVNPNGNVLLYGTGNATVDRVDFYGSLTWFV